MTFNQKCPECGNEMIMTGGANKGILDQNEHTYYECITLSCKIKEVEITWRNLK